MVTPNHPTTTENSVEIDIRIWNNFLHAPYPLSRVKNNFKKKIQLDISWQGRSPSAG
jgi:hypothetical protein